MYICIHVYMNICMYGGHRFTTDHNALHHGPTTRLTTDQVRGLTTDRKKRNHGPKPNVTTD